MNFLGALELFLAPDKVILLLAGPLLAAAAGWPTMVEGLLLAAAVLPAPTAGWPVVAEVLPLLGGVLQAPAAGWPAVAEVLPLLVSTNQVPSSKGAALQAVAETNLLHITAVPWHTTRPSRHLATV